MRQSSSLILIAPLLAVWVTAPAGTPAAGMPATGTPAAGTPVVGINTLAQTKTPAVRAAAHTPARGKYAAPVSLRFSLPKRLTANTPIEVSIEVTPGIDADELLVEWIPSAGLVLTAADNPLHLEAVKQGQTYQRTLTLTTTADGEYRLGAVVALKTGASRQTHAFASRLQVGASVTRSKAALTRDAKHMLIEATPAQESVSKK